MSENIKSEMISRRRALSLMGLAAALCLSVPPTLLTASDAEAQAAPPPTTPPAATPPVAPKTGMERRYERRKHRRERRYERREHRRERRLERRRRRREPASGEKPAK